MEAVREKKQEEVSTKKTKKEQSGSQNVHTIPRAG